MFTSLIFCIHVPWGSLKEAMGSGFEVGRESLKGLQDSWPPILALCTILFAVSLRHLTTFKCAFLLEERLGQLILRIDVSLVITQTVWLAVCYLLRRKWTCASEERI